MPPFRVNAEMGALTLDGKFAEGAIINTFTEKWQAAA
jgi:hypothetical protein